MDHENALVYGPSTWISYLEIVLLIILLVGGVFLKFRKRFGRSKYTRSKSTTSRKHTPARHQPFDANTGTPPHAKAVVQGSAYVVDGDTIVIRKTQIRLFGIDAPEIDHPFGKKAKWALVSLCKGQTVRAEVDEQDAHGRLVAHCYLQDGRNLSSEMVKLSLAIDWPKFSGGEYRSLEVPGVRKKLWLADARQKGRMHVWKQFEAKKNTH